MPRVIPHLPQVSLHRLSRPKRVAMLHGVEDSLVVVLPALRPAIHMEDAQTLFAQNPDDRINQRENEGLVAASASAR